ncbi:MULTISPECIES: DegT/DnrJ/EryC1/StrS family aminotransferase [unclassified Chitinophaga]|uniref:DegT/DnrJ/EryC1/StrS family aminotransferase n=1 Tax=unclassified Chitinophaga TaxID=2619133 RepID=UPI00300FC87A
MKYNSDRRDFIAKVSAGTLAYLAAYSIPSFARTSNDPDKLAILGGVPVRDNMTWPQWPYRNQKMIDNLTETTKSGIWSRIDADKTRVSQWELDFAAMTGAQYAVATGSGTQSLSTSLFALGIGPGDEVITSPYTDMGTVSAIITCHALPVFADLDPLSFQLNAKDVENKITTRTKAIIPVHMLGAPCEMEPIMAIAKKHRLYIVEDAAQAHLASYQGQKVGNIGNLGCFSFQGSKQVSCGEGGAVIGSDKQLMDKVYTVMNHGTARTPMVDANGKILGDHVRIGPKYRMNEFQASVLNGQQDTIQQRFDIRNNNAIYLREQLKDFPGLKVQKMFEGTDSASYYLFGMSYQKEHFNNADRSLFLKAIGAEGVGLSGYISQGLHREPWTGYIMEQQGYKSMFGKKRLQQWKESLYLPECDKACGQMAGLYAVGTLLGTRKDMDSIIAAIMKVHKNRDQLAKLA